MTISYTTFADDQENSVMQASVDCQRLWHDWTAPALLSKSFRTVFGNLGERFVQPTSWNHLEIYGINAALDLGLPKSRVSFWVLGSAATLCNRSGLDVWPVLQTISWHFWVDRMERSRQQRLPVPDASKEIFASSCRCREARSRGHCDLNISDCNILHYTLSNLYCIELQCIISAEVVLSYIQNICYITYDTFISYLWIFLYYTTLYARRRHNILC